MKAKEYLQQLQWLDTVINQKIKELDDLRSMAAGAGSIDYSKERVKTSRSGDASFVKLIERMLDLDEKINQEIDAFVDKKHKIINQIQALKDSKHIDILYKRYVEFKSLDRICVEMNFSYDYIKHLHKYALQDFEKKILN